MIELHIQAPILLRRWFSLHDEHPELIDASRYLLLGAELTETLRLPVPDLPTLTELLRTLRDRGSKLFPYVVDLAQKSSFGHQLFVELALDQLIAAAPDWPHPSLVLERPRPPFSDLLAACNARLKSAEPSQRPHIQAVRDKLARASRIAQEALERRHRLSRGRKRR